MFKKRKSRTKVIRSVCMEAYLITILSGAGRVGTNKKVTCAQTWRKKCALKDVTKGYWTCVTLGEKSCLQDSVFSPVK